MSEWAQVLNLVPKFFALFLFSFFYVIGGREEKLWRRIFAGFLFFVGCLISSYFSFSLSWKILSVLLVIPPLWLGYSKPQERIIYGLALGCSGFMIGLIYGKLTYGLFQALISFSVTVFMGLKNPDPSAVDEECVIALCSVILIPFIIS